MLDTNLHVVGQRVRAMAAYNASVLTFANLPFAHVAINFVAHMHRVPKAPPFVMHCLDDATFTLCERVVDASTGSCVRAPCCNATQGRASDRSPESQVVEAIQTYKLHAAHATLLRTQQPVLLLDATSLVASRACFDELLSFPEDDIVTSAEFVTCPACPGKRPQAALALSRARRSDINHKCPFACGRGAHGCPPMYANVLHAAANTGAILFRPTAAAFLGALLQPRGVGASIDAGTRSDSLPPFEGTEADPSGRARHTQKLLYHTHCYEQELFNGALLRHGAAWLAYPSVAAIIDGAMPPLSITSPRFTLADRLGDVLQGPRLTKALHGSAERLRRIRFLNYSHWPRDNVRWAVAHNPNLPLAEVQWFVPEPRGTACLYHPVVVNKKDHIRRYRGDGFWYL